MFIDYFIGMDTNLIIAALLLSSPPQLNDPWAEKWNNPFILLTVQCMAVENEILDVRETRYMFIRNTEFTSDLNILRRRFIELANSPLTSDSDQFPDRSLISSYLAFNRAYKHHLEMQAMYYTWHYEWYRQAIKETDELFRIWDLIRDASTPYYYVTTRREALMKLKKELGDDCYYQGIFPPYVPIWRFEELK